MVVDGQLAESLTLPPTNPVAMLKGGRQLQPEESVNLSLGAVFSLGAVDVSLDWFRIDVDDRIALTQQSLSDRDRADLVAANFIGVDDLFDKQPDEHRFAGVAGYLGADFPLNHPSGFNGGSYYLRFDAAF